MWFSERYSSKREGGMDNIVPFPETLRELLVIKIFRAPLPELYALVIVDPRIGELRPHRYIDKKRVRKLIPVLADYAKDRRFDFEVHDLSSEMELVIHDNDNS